MRTDKPIGYLLIETLKVYRDLISISLKKKHIDISFEQYVVLKLLSLEEDPIQQDLAKQLNKDKSIILRQTNALIKKNFVFRTVDQEDQRRKKLLLTPQGQETISRIKIMEQQTEEIMLKGINKPAQDTVARILGIMYTNGRTAEMQTKYT